MALTTPPSQLENIKVAVRLRPFTERERQRGCRRIVDIEKNTVVLYDPKHGDLTDSNAKKFTFDYSYWSHDGFKKDKNGVNVPDPNHPNHEKYVAQERVFEDLGRFLLNNTLEGYNSALLAYGQTGSGKSYTVSGYGVNEGILPRFARALYEELDKRKSETSESSRQLSDYEVSFSMLEIYNEVVRDLLADSADLTTGSQAYLGDGIYARRGLKVREHPKHGFFVVGLKTFVCANKDEIEKRLNEGHLNKSIAATSMNETSSRGHTIYEFRIKQIGRERSATPQQSRTGGSSSRLGADSTTMSVVQLVDLAGSERMTVHVTGQLGGDSYIGSRANSPANLRPLLSASNSGSNRASVKPSSAASMIQQQQQQSMVQQYRSGNKRRFKESVSINQSLSTLGKCIQIMSQYSQQLADPTSRASSRNSPPKIPYRDSVLTKLLNRYSLNGSSKVVIIANLSPADSNYDDTLSTLRFADRAKQIKTHAIINRADLDNLQKENGRLRPTVDGQQDTRSDDSSEASNFDDSESMVENFSGPIKSRNQVDVMATPSRAKTTNRSKNTSGISVISNKNSGTTELKNKAVRGSMRQSEVPGARSMQNLSSNSSNEKRRIAKPPANESKIASDQGMRKSRSVAHGLQADALLEGMIDDDDQEAELKGGGMQLSFDSDESISALADEDLSDEKKIHIFNKMLSNNSSKITHQQQSAAKSKESGVASTKSKMERPKRRRVGMRNVSVLSSSLKKANPYLSNLNPDEQLTGLINFIIKVGENTIGKSDKCDIVLHGPELRSEHAKIVRDGPQTGSDSTRSNGDADKSQASISDQMPYEIYIEPILPNGASSEKDADQRVALMVNGSPVTSRLKLSHCDRILFGANNYFVFINNNRETQNSTDNSVADFDLVTYEMAQSEIARKEMSKERKEAISKEIQSIAMRPGTAGKMRSKQQIRQTSASKPSSRDTFRVRSIENETDYPEEQDFEKLQASLHEELLKDFDECARCLNEVSAIVEEMSIKVTYSAVFLTGEEQLLSGNSMLATDSNASDRFSSSSVTGESNDGRRVGTGTGTGNQTDDETLNKGIVQVTELNGISDIDTPLAIYVKVHLDSSHLDFYWSRDKFQDRLYKIRELYGVWDVGGKSALVEYLIEQLKIQGDYLLDPFVDDPLTTFVLIGHSQISMQPISLLTDSEQDYDIVDLNTDIIGSIRIRIVPCHVDEEVPPTVEPYRTFSEDDLRKNLIENSSELLNRKLVFLLKIVSCSNLPDKFVNIFCQYALQSNGPIFRSKLVRYSENNSQPQDSAASTISSVSNNSNNLSDEFSKALIFNHSHYICFQSVNQDTLDFLDHGFLGIQIVGQYKMQNYNRMRPPTVISTIIDSIQKYKFKMLTSTGGNQQTNQSSIYNFNSSNTDSIGSQRAAMNSGAGSGTSTIGTMMYDQANEDEDQSNSVNGLSQENIIDMILTKRKLDRAENKLYYLRRTVKLAENYNKRNIPVKTVKKLLTSQAFQLDNGSLEEMAADATIKGNASTRKHSPCVVQ